MNVKNYIGNDKAELMAKIRRELGPDTVILDTRKIRKKGIAGFFGKKIVKIVVAIDDTRKPENTRVNNENDIKMQEALAAIRNLSHDLAESEKKAEIKKKEEYKNDNEIKRSQADILANEVDDLKAMVSDLVVQMKSLKQEIADDVRNRASDFSEDANKDANKIDGQNKIANSSHKDNNQEENQKEAIKENDFYSEIREKLINKGVTIDTVNSILNSFKIHGNEVENKEQIEDAMDKILSPIENIKIGPKNQVLLFVGPTGVGKTTTLAKLAAKLALIDGCSVGLITADTFRIAAVDQLRTYSEILGIPFTVIYEPSEIKDVLYAYKDKDFILVDTAGRSHKSLELREDLSNLLKNFENVEVFLVMSLTTGYNDMVSIIDSYSFIKEYKFIFTKLDESDSFVNILNIKSICPAPMSYFTTGQNVPDDIEVASSKKIISYILEE